MLDLAVGMTVTPVQVSDELFAALQQHFDEGQLVELVNVIAVENLRSRFNAAFAIGSTGFSEGMACARMEPPRGPPGAGRFDAGSRSCARSAEPGGHAGRRVRVFLAGATGVIGAPLVRLLIADGHQVTGMTRSPGKADALRAAGAEPVVADALDAAAVMSAVGEARPDAVIHQLTSIPARLDPRKIERDFALTDRLRTEGTRHLVAAAAGGRRAARSSPRASPSPTRRGPPARSTARTIPCIANPPGQFRRSAAAIAELERTVLGAGGLVLRYGYFYGPGSAISRGGSIGREVARRRLPIVGGGSGVWSFIHVDDAARATVAALAAGAPGAYNVVDDEPAPVSRVAPRARRRARRQAAAPRARVARAPAGRRVRRDDDDPGAGRVQRARQAPSSAGRPATRAGARASRQRSAEPPAALRLLAHHQHDAGHAAARGRAIRCSADG